MLLLNPMFVMQSYDNHRIDRSILQIEKADLNRQSYVFRCISYFVR